MKTLLISVAQLIISSGLLYGYYHFFLRNKKFHQYNRYFLLLAAVISICIPFINIPVYFEGDEAKPVILQSLTLLSSEGFEDEMISNNTPTEIAWFTWKNILSSIYLLIAGTLFIRFIVALVRIARLVQVYPGEKLGNIHFITTNEPATPFSFFRWLFWNKKIELNSDTGQQIFRHELFHIRQKHSRDIIFLEITTLIFWINPFFHLIKKEIKAIHEFLADKFAVEENKEWDYAELLLMQVLGSPATRLTHPFFHNQIKRRIAMLTTSKKPGYQYLRKIMVLPLAVIIIGLFAFTYKNKVNPKTWSEEPVTIVIDAGHGGTDPGASSPDAKYHEAQLSLEIAKTLKDLAQEYNITVVMTRDNENFPGGASDKNEANRKRVAIANGLKPVAFISIHMNNKAGENFQNSHSGFEAFISKKRDAKADKILASAILQNLAPLYKTRTEARMFNQTGVYVLDQNNSPAVLLECGFMNNMADLDFVKSRSNQEKIARSILAAIVVYQRNKQENALPATTDTMPSKPDKKSIVATSQTDKVTLQADSIKLVALKKQPIHPRVPGNKKTALVTANTIKPKNELVVVGYPSKNINKEKVVIGYPAKKTSTEKLVTGYPTKNTNTEKVVVGYPSKNTNTEKVVTGYPTKNTNTEKVVIGYPSKNTNTEKLVTGYPTKNTNTEKVVIGYPSKKNE